MRRPLQEPWKQASLAINLWHKGHRETLAVLSIALNRSAIANWAMPCFIVSVLRVLGVLGSQNLKQQNPRCALAPLARLKNKLAASQQACYFTIEVFRSSCIVLMYWILLMLTTTCKFYPYAERDSRGESYEVWVSVAERHSAVTQM